MRELNQGAWFVKSCIYNLTCEPIGVCGLAIINDGIALISKFNTIEGVIGPGMNFSLLILVT